MLIKNLFERKIDRYIQAAVVANDLKADRVHQEIQEYIFTDDLVINLMSFLNAMSNSQENTGVWIKGFYGSGKSHFIKYLYYCMEQSYSKNALANIETFVREHKDPLFEVSHGKFKEVERNLQSVETDKILFNIAYSSGDKERKDTITRIFLNELNKYRGYNNSNIDFAVLVEKTLDKKGKLEAFKEQIQEKLEEDWTKNHYNLIFGALAEVLEIAKELDDTLDVDTIHQKVNESQKDFSTEFLIHEFVDFLSGQSEDHRLIFLVDEVSQYIGDNANLLLDLQTIVEAVSQDHSLKGRVWIVCTAQEDLGSLVDRNLEKAKDDFGKIMARFETKISLESQSASYITQRRLLDKNSEGIGELNSFYKNYKGAIQNQFDFGHDLYKGFEGKEDFIQAYPFVPYQFDLISDVLYSFQVQKFVTEGVKDSERSILGISHATAKERAENKVGYFIPFDAFFNSALRKDMTQYARNMIERAYNLEKVKHDDFSKRVVNALFMISNLSETRKVNFPATSDNLVQILMDQIDQSKGDLMSTTQEVLDELVKKNIVQFNDGVYRFLQEDEINVANLIDSQRINANERLEWLAKDILQPIINPKNRQEYNGTPFKVTFKIDDYELFPKGGDFEVSVRIYEGAGPEQIAIHTPKHELAICLNTAFNQDENLKSQLLTYMKTKKFLRDNRTDAKGQREATLRQFGEVNEKVLQEIKTRFERLVLESTIVSAQQVFQASEFPSESIPARYQKYLDKHLGSLYKKQKFAQKYAHTNEALKESERKMQRTIDNELLPAEDEVLTKIGLLGDGCTVAEIVKEFAKAPYGWKDLATIDVVLHLLKKGKRQVEWKNEAIDEQKFVDKALNKREQDSITIHQVDDVDVDTLKSFYKVLSSDIFPEGALRYEPTKDLRTTVEDFKLFLVNHLKESNELKHGYEGYRFNKYFSSFHSALRDLHEERNPATLVQTVLDEKEQLKKQRDEFVQAKEFVNDQFKKYQEIEAFHKKEHVNYSELDEVDEKRGELLDEYFNSSSYPWGDFPQINKAFKELSQAIGEVVDKLRQKVINKINQMVSDLEIKSNELNINETHLLPDKKRLIKQFESVDEITKLKLALNVEIPQMQTDYLKSLQAYHDKKEAEEKGKKYVQPYEVSFAEEAPPKVIESEEELDKYLKDLRASLLKKLKDNKRIFLH